MERKYKEKPQQTISSLNISETKHKVQKAKKEASQGDNSGQKMETKIVGFKNRLQEVSRDAGGDMLQPSNVTNHGDMSQSSYANVQYQSVWRPSKSVVATVGASQCENESLEKLFLDFESVQLMKDDADEDSASDLSDSERIPIPPSPFTPPELLLRAEEIEPEHFNLPLEPKCKEYQYADFLPPPYRSWNLPQLANFLNTEGKHSQRPAPSGFLERYVDRLLQLEWLQMQTVQTEKLKAAKARPQTASGISCNGKTPTKNKSWHSPMPSKQIPRLDINSTSNISQENYFHRKGFHSEVTGSACSQRSCSKVSDSPGAFSSGRKQTQDVRALMKKRPVLCCQQSKDLQSFETNPKIQSIDNIRPQKPPFSHRPESTLKLIKSSTHSNFKKNGTSASSLISTKQSTSERKLKANTSKISSLKVKQI
ncbi:protein FAM217B [Rhinophrynus dorsalis]